MPLVLQRILVEKGDLIALRVAGMVFQLLVGRLVLLRLDCILVSAEKPADDEAGVHLKC